MENLTVRISPKSIRISWQENGEKKSRECRLSKDAPLIFTETPAAGSPANEYGYEKIRQMTEEIRKK